MTGATTEKEGDAAMIVEEKEEISSQGRTDQVEITKIF